MRELIYAGEPTSIRNWLEAKLNASEAERARACERYPQMSEPGSAEAVDEIYSRDGDVARILVSGPLSMAGPDAWDRYMGYGGVAYPTIIAAVRTALDDPSVKSIDFYSDTPGGEVNGSDLTWQAHAGAAAKKKTRCLVSGMLASAGYYIMCPARLEASAPTDMIGSIGVIYATWDFTEAYGSMGIKHVEIRSSNAPKKAMDGSTKAGRDVIQDRVDAIERVFYQRISEARGVSPDFIREHFGQGALLVARDPDSTKPDALRSKMIDGLASEPGEFPIPTDPENEDARAEAAPAASTESHPAVAGISPKQEAIKMASLTELLAQNPAAAAEIDKIKAAEYDRGRAEQLKVSTRVGEILTAEAYAGNKVIRAKAADVLSGKMELASFEAVVAAADMQAESRKSDQAAGETDAQGETGATGPKNEAAQQKADADLVAGFFPKAKEGK